MPSPFPGMDPYLESPKRWGSVHQWLTTFMAAHLNRSLPPGYVAALDHYVWVRRAPDDPGVPLGRPDVTVSPWNGWPAERGAAGATRGAAAPTAETTLSRARIGRKGQVKIVNAESGEVYTVIELLSPANKRRGDDRAAYLAKRQEYLAARVNLLEIDLLRSGTRPPLGEPPPPASDYVVALCPTDRMARMLIWAFDVRDPIPVVPVPFESGVPAVTLDLRECLDRAYDEGRYAGLVRYDAPADPPLRKLDAAWAAELLKARAATSPPAT